MARCIIHIGMHKTGTTSIQGSLKELDDDKFLYARIGGAGNHSVPFVRMFSQQPEAFRFHGGGRRQAEKLPKKANVARRKLRNAIANAGDRTLILCGEGIALLNSAEVESVRDWFREQSCDVEIFAYVRPPAAFMSSSMQQRLRENTGGAIDVRKFYPNYRERFEKFEAAFGADRVRFRKFVPSEMKDQDVVTDFCLHFGIDPGRMAKARRNEARSKAVLYSQFQYRRMRRELGLPRLAGGAEDLEILADLDRSRFRISPNLTRPVLADNAADIAWMEQRLGQSLEEELGEEAPADFRSMDDLLTPVPGARERLLEALQQAGADLPDGQSLSLYHLIGLWAERQSGKRGRRSDP